MLRRLDQFGRQLGCRLGRPKLLLRRAGLEHVIEDIKDASHRANQDVRLRGLRPDRLELATLEELRDEPHIGYDAVVLNVAEGECRRGSRVRRGRVERGIDELDTPLFKFINRRRWRTDTLGCAHLAPEKLVHHQDACHGHRLARPKRLDGGPEPAVHNQRVHLWEQCSKVCLGHLEEGTLHRAPG